MVHDSQDVSFKEFFTPLTTVKAIHIIVIVSLIVFFNSLFNGFVWDDRNFVQFNPDIHSFNIVKIFGQSAFNSPADGYYRPVTAFYYTIVYTLFQNTPFFYHVFQLTFHIINATFVFFLFKQFFNKWLSLFLSLLFLIHPIQAESVSFIAQTDSTLFFLFGMIALLLSEKDHIGIKRLFLLCGFLLLSSLTKETGFLFLLLLILYRVLLKKHQVFVFVMLGCITTVLYFLLRFNIGKVYLTKDYIVPIVLLPLATRLINIPSIVLHYLTTFFFPTHLAIDQQWVVRIINFHDFYGPLLVDVMFFGLLALLGVYLIRVNTIAFRIYIFFMGWFVLGLAIHSQIIPLDMTVADRWFYFPIAGMLGMIGAGVQALLFSPDTKRNFLSNEKVKLVTSLLGSVLILLLSIRTIVRNTNWYDNMTLYSHDTTIYDGFMAENNLGSEYEAQNNIPEAYKHFKKSVDLFPFYGASLFNLGYMYEVMHNPQKAETYYTRAIHVTQYTAKRRTYFSLAQEYSYLGLVRVLLASGKPNAVRDVVKSGLNEYPNAGVLWVTLAISDYTLHNQAEALYAAEKAKTLIPGERTNALTTQILTKKTIQVHQYLNYPY